MQGSGALDLDPVRGEPVLAEPGARLAFEPVHDAPISAGVDRRAAAACGCG